MPKKWKVRKLALFTPLLFLFLIGCESVPEAPKAPAAPEVSERVCSLDQSSMHIIKCWGSCPNADSVCRLRWRAKGSEDEWETDHSDYRNRDAERDAELEYSCFCEIPAA